MPNYLKNSTLSNSAIRSRSIMPDPKNYFEFLELLYQDIDFIIRKLSKSRDKYAQGMKDNPKTGEDLINTFICDMLEMRGWTARHDTSVNGHPDIVVELLGENYQWLGESKINNSNTYIYKGFNQLMHRYSTGLNNENAGGILIYINQSDKSQLEILNDWESYLTNKVGNLNKCFDLRNSLVFCSHHKHPSSGLDYTIRHMVIDFRYNPQDNKKSVKPNL